MKKVGFMIVIMLTSLSAAFSQKIAVLDFKAGVNISQTDVDGLSSTFVTYFNPRGYQLVERSQINQVIEEQGFQQSSLTESQMVRLGQIMNLSKIVVGDVNIVGGSPNLDVRVIDVQSGEVTGRDGATFAWTNYRATMQQLAQKVAGQIGVVYGGSGKSGYAQPSGKSPSGKVETILGYLQVYPEDLGSFAGRPKTVIAAINRQKLYDYGDWRLPTNEELSLMATARAKLGMGSINGYMSQENADSGGMRIVRLVRSEDYSENAGNYEDNGSSFIDFSENDESFEDFSGNSENSIIRIRLQPLQNKTHIITSKANIMTIMEIQSQTLNQSQSMETRQSFSAIKVTDNQSTFETQIEAIKMTISQMGIKLEYDSEHPEKTSPMLSGQTKEIEQNIKKPSMIKYDALGKVVDSPDLEMSQLSSAIIQLPEKEVKVGSSWSFNQVQRVSGNDITSKYTYIVTAISKKSVNVNITGNVESTSASGTYSGTASIDPRTGLVIRSSIKSNISMILNEQGMSIPTTIVGNTTVEVK